MLLFLSTTEEVPKMLNKQPEEKLQVWGVTWSSNKSNMTGKFVSGIDKLKKKY